MNGKFNWRDLEPKKIIAWFFLFIITFGGIYTGHLLYDESKEVKTEQPIVYSNIDFELGIIKADLQTYNKLSNEVIDNIIKALRETSIKYQLPVGLLHCINRVESEYQFNIVHPTVTVTANGKSITTNAVGAGGIIWIFWGDLLKKEKIAQMESDLFFPDKSIRATGYILRYMINEEYEKNNNDSTKINNLNILEIIIKRYYGAYSQQYLARMPKITSDLWMKRIANEIVGHKDTKAIYVLNNKETTKIRK